MPRARAPSSCGKSPRTRTQTAVERQLAHEQHALQRLRRDDADRTQNPDRDRQIQRGSALAHVGRRQITVMAYSSSCTPSRASALCTRTRASRTAASARPTN